MRRQGQPFGTTNQQLPQQQQPLSQYHQGTKFGGGVHSMSQYPSTSSDPNYGNSQINYGQTSGWPGFSNLPYPSGSKSACASPGPMQKFRQTYCKDTLVPSQNGSPYQKPVNQHTAMWMQNYHGAGAYPSYSSSAAPSVISNMSGYSAISNMSQLSIATDMTDTPYLHEYMPQQPSSTASGSSMAENIDPNFYQKMDSFTETLILSLSHPHPEEQRKAVGSLYQAAKLEQFSYVTSPERLQRLINQIFNTISHPTLNEEVKHRLLAAVFHLVSSKCTLQVIQTVFLQTRGAVVHVLCNLLNPQMKYSNYTICILNTLFRQPGKFGGQCRQCARTKMVIDRHMQILEANIGVRIYIAIDNIKCIINSCEELKIYFTRQNGMQLLLKLIEKESDERILYSSCNLLYTLVNTDKNTDYAEYFVKIKGVQILSSHLDHGSSRYLNEILRCLSAVSDTNSIALENIHSAMYRAIQILGSTDLTLVRNATGFLCNVAAKNKDNKVYLCENGSIENLMRIVEVLSSSTEVPKEMTWVYQEIYDNALLGIINLTSNYHPHHMGYVQVACRQVIQKSNSMKILLNTLVKGNFLIQSRVLILARIITNEPNAHGLFIDVFDDKHHMNFVFATYSLLFEAVDAFVDPVKHANLKSKLQDMIVKLLKILREFMKNRAFAVQVVNLSRSHKNPISLLTKLGHTQLSIALIEFLDDLLEDDDLLMEWNKNEEIREILELCSNSQIHDLAKVASHLLRRIHPLVHFNEGFSADWEMSTY